MTGVMTSIAPVTRGGWTLMQAREIGLPGGTLEPLLKAFGVPLWGVRWELSQVSWREPHTALLRPKFFLKALAREQSGAVF